MKPLLLAATFPILLLGTNVTLAEEELTPREVLDAMKAGVQYLDDHQQVRADGSGGTWPDYSGQEGGVTALCTLALLNAGEPTTESHVKRALKYLSGLPAKTTYVVSLQTMVLCRADPKGYADVIARNVQWLEDQQITAGVTDRRGGWSYGNNDLGARAVAPGDGSNSQFALLALYEAARAAETYPDLHVTIRHDTWKRAQQYWIANCCADGGWGYLKPMAPTGSMTCAGISSMVISSDVLHEPDAKVVGDRIDSCYRSPAEDRQKVDAGIEWLRQNHFTVKANPPAEAGGTGLWHYYFLYGLERACRLSARRKIGENDWYREGAKYLVHSALLDGGWMGTGHAETNPDTATALALLFLSKGRWPVLMAKVQYGTPQPGVLRDSDIQWNRHRNDVNNLTIYTESRWRMEMTWQQIDLSKASVDDLLQVPVLFFSGGGNPLPDNEDQQQRLADNLRDYIDRGNFIFADGESCSPDFDAGFRKLMELVFRKPEYRFKPLDESHPVWRAEEQVPPNQVRALLGIDYGCRTSVIYALPKGPSGEERPSLAALWELSRGGPQESYSPSVKAQIHGGLIIGVNVLAYATNRELKKKEEIAAHEVTIGPGDARVRGKLAIAKLEHAGGCDAAPRALANLMEQAARDLPGFRVETHPKLIGITDPALFDHPVVFIHGRNGFRFTDNERQALRKYIDRGGMLFGDAICGSEAFADSFTHEMAIIFPSNPLKAIPSSDPIWTPKFGGYDLKSVTRRDPLPPVAGEPLKSTLRQVPPELKGIRFGDHYGVIFSAFDLSCALEKHDSLECRGYSREDAARIGMNILLYSMQKE